MKVVVASDKFKGSLSSSEVAGAVRQGILDAVPGCDVVCIPVADGGDGTADALVKARRGFWVETTVSGPLGKPVAARYGVINGDTVVLDVASASGLALLDEHDRNPLETTSIGTGELIRCAIGFGYRKFMIGLGGSATNDAAAGILAGLGYRFFDRDGKVLFPSGKNLAAVSRIDDSLAVSGLPECRFSLLCDVDAAFYGENGAAYVFAPQKGADADDVHSLDAGLRSFAAVLQDVSGVDVRALKYAGAAGGIAGGLCAVLGAKAVCGIDAVLDTIGFDGIIADSDYVVTGEGRMDKTTLLGKTPYGICNAARSQGVPVVAFTADVSDCDALNAAGFLSVFPIVPGVVSKEESMLPENARSNLRRVASQIFRLISEKRFDGVK